MVPPNRFFVLISEAWECFNNENNHLLCSQYTIQPIPQTAPVITRSTRSDESRQEKPCWSCWKVRGDVCVVVIYLLQKDEMMVRNDSDWFVSHSSDKASLQSETCQPASFSSFHLRQQPVSQSVSHQQEIFPHHLAVLSTVIPLLCHHLRRLRIVWRLDHNQHWSWMNGDMKPHAYSKVSTQYVLPIFPKKNFL